MMRLRFIYLETRGKACNVRLAVAQRYATYSLKLKLLSIYGFKLSVPFCKLHGFYNKTR